MKFLKARKNILLSVLLTAAVLTGLVMLSGTATASPKGQGDVVTNGFGYGYMPPGLAKNGNDPRDGKFTPPGWSQGEKNGWTK